MSKKLNEKHKKQRKTRRYEERKQQQQEARDLFWKQVSSPEGLHIRF